MRCPRSAPLCSYGKNQRKINRKAGATFSTHILWSHARMSKKRTRNQSRSAPLSAAQDVPLMAPKSSLLALTAAYRDFPSGLDRGRGLLARNSCARRRTKKTKSSYLRERGRSRSSPSTRRASSHRQHVTIVTHTGQPLCPRALTRSLSYQKLFTNVGRLIGGRV